MENISYKITLTQLIAYQEVLSYKANEAITKFSYLLYLKVLNLNVVIIEPHVAQNTFFHIYSLFIFCCVL
jgi:hypothetical protein